MRISVKDAGKRFNHEWIFRHFTFEFLPGHKYAITGANGSGKSTLLQVIAGAALVSEGEIRYEKTIPDTRYQIPDGANKISESEVSDETKNASIIKPYPESGIRYPVIMEPYKHLSFTAPYLELIEEMTASEFLSFHSTFKKLTADIDFILSETGLFQSAAKQIRYFSSGMKQRLKLAQGFFSETSAILLDEPTTNLDSEGVTLYQNLLTKYGNNRLVIISSNDVHEYRDCENVINVSDYK